MKKYNIEIISPENKESDKKNLIEKILKSFNDQLKIHPNEKLTYSLYYNKIVSNNIMDEISSIYKEAGWKNVSYITHSDQRDGDTTILTLSMI